MKEHSSVYVVGLTMVATLGGLLFGYDTAVISGAEKSIQAYLINGNGLGTLAHGATISSALIGCIIGGMISGLIAWKLGRRNSLLIAAFLFFFSSIGSGWPEAFFFTQGHPTMGLLFMFNFYRIVGGIGVGIASAIVPMYIGEIAPAEMRGRLVSLNQIAIISGMLVVYFVNYGIAHGQTVEWINAIGWRWMFTSAAIPSAIFAILLFFVPETPRYLALNNQPERALAILTKINGKAKAALIFKDIKKSVEASSEKLFAFGKLVVVIGILLSVFQQFVGINVALYYAPRIFESMGAGKDTSMLQTVVMGLVNVVFSALAVFLVDKHGRKPLLMIGSIGMAVGMFAIGALAFMKIIGISTLVFIIIYTASFMMSWGPVCWVLISEIFPNKIRGRAIAIAVAAQWAANYFISSTYPAMMEFSGGITYWFYGLMSILSFIFIWKIVPETKGMTLEAMEGLWLKKR